MTIEQEEEAFVEQMLDEALSEQEGAWAEDELRVLRGCLRDELLFHPQGRAKVRAAMAAASQAASDVHAKEPHAAGTENPDKARRKGDGS